MKLKKYNVLAAAVLAAFALTACGGSETASNEGGDSGASGDQIEIDFFHRWPNDPKNAMFKDLVARYEEENPNVKINMDCILNDQYKEKIRMIVPTDEVPDIFSS